MTWGPGWEIPQSSVPSAESSPRSPLCDNMQKLMVLEAYAKYDTGAKTHKQTVITTLIKNFGDGLLSSILMDGTEHTFCREIATELQDEMMANWKGRKNPPNT